jgi:serine protease Do
MTALTDLAERLRPSIIGVRRGGSGVVIAPGVAVTLWRNVRAGDATVALAGGEAELLGADRSADLAALRVDPALPPVPWSDAGPLRIGDPVFALADPAGRGLRATAGAVSSAPRPVRGPGGRLIEGALEHTAPLPRGAGGGPLVDAEGAILGLNALRAGDGLIVAWPVSALRERAQQLAEGRSTAPPTLGIALAGPRQARRLRAAAGLPEAEGLLVRAVQEGSAAERAGLARGDVITAANGTPMTGIDDLFAAIDAGPGEIELALVRGAEETTAKVQR